METPLEYPLQEIDLTGIGRVPAPSNSRRPLKPYAFLEYYIGGKSRPLHLSDTDVCVWDISAPADSLRLVGDEPYLEKLGSQFSSTSRNETQDVPSLIITIATGDPTSVVEPMSISKSAFDLTMEALWSKEEAHRIFQCRYPHIDGDLRWDAHNKPEFFAISLRCPINHLVLLGVIRINLIDLTSAAFISLIPKENAESFQQRCHDYADILAIHPLYLLVVIFEERFETWMEWFAGVWKTVSDIEAVTGMTKVEWMERFPKRRMEEFRNPRTLMKALHGAHVELAHCTTIMAFAKRFGTTSKMCIEDFEGAREQLGLDPLNKGKRTKLERRLRVTVGKFEAMVDRVEEMKARLKGQIDVVFSLIAQKDSKNQFLIAQRQGSIAELTSEDSKVMKTIGVLTLVFLPASLVTSIWSANIVRLEPGLNWKIWLTTTVAVTVFVFTCWVLYRQLAKKKPAPIEDDPEEALV